MSVHTVINGLFCPFGELGESAINDRTISRGTLSPWPENIVCVLGQKVCPLQSEKGGVSGYGYVGGCFTSRCDWYTVYTSAYGSCFLLLVL